MRVLVEGMEDKVSKDNCEMVVITPEGGYQVLDDDTIDALITQAKEQKSKEDA
jgi:20S proteasome alpha/beta subunit